MNRNFPLGSLALAALFVSASGCESMKGFGRKEKPPIRSEPIASDVGSESKEVRTTVAVPDGGTILLGGKPATPITTKDLSLTQAHAILQAAARKSDEIKTKMDIAVVDAGGNLKAFARQDGAWLGSIDISIKKARTARYFDMPTGEIGKLSQPGGPLYHIEHSNNGLITFPGGLPIKDADGTIIGAIGVSGSSVENDHTVAAAGVAALGGK